MSLLMDALKKAEASKRQAGESDTAASISLTPLSARRLIHRSVDKASGR